MKWAWEPLHTFQTFTSTTSSMIELVRSYDVFSNTISTSVAEFMITSEKVRYAFGLNCIVDLFEKKQVDFENKLNEEERQTLNDKTLTFVHDMVRNCPIETEEQKRNFKRAFSVLSKKFSLRTSAPNISPIHLPMIKDIENTRSRNWVHHVNSFLINGIKEFKDKNIQAVKGCYFVLIIIYFEERYEGKSLNDPNAPAPWIRHWYGETLRKKIKAEDDDITISKNVS